MSYIKRSECFTNTPNGSKMRVFAGHIKKETALKYNFRQVNLRIFDMSGRGRSETRVFYAPEFINMKSFN